jgi:acetyl-CoA synthetase
MNQSARRLESNNRRSIVSTQEPTTAFVPTPEMKDAHVSGMAAYDKLVAEAEADYSGYRSRLAREFLSWKTPFT